MIGTFVVIKQSFCKMFPEINDAYLNKGTNFNNLSSILQQGKYYRTELSDGSKLRGKTFQLIGLRW